MTNGKTWLAWAAPIWLAANSTALWVVSSLVFDWRCGPPSDDGCRFGDLHPILQVYLFGSFAGMGVLVLVTAVFAIQRRLTRLGLAGLCLSLAVVSGLTGIILFGH